MRLKNQSAIKIISQKAYNDKSLLLETFPKDEMKTTCQVLRLNNLNDYPLWFLYNNHNIEQESLDKQEASRHLEPHFLIVRDHIEL